MPATLERSDRGPARPHRRVPPARAAALLRAAAVVLLLPAAAGGMPPESLDGTARGVERLASAGGEVTLRASDDGDPATWEGLLQAWHRRSGGGVAYAVQVRLRGEGPRTVYARAFDFMPPSGNGCGPAPAPLQSGAAADQMAFYRCALARCFALARRCAGPGPHATACLAERCREALLSCVDDTLGCDG